MSKSSKDNLVFKFDELNKYLKEDSRQHRQMASQGANAIIVIYPPEQEDRYLQALRENYPQEALINIAELFTECIDSYGKEEFENLLGMYRSEPEKMFKSDSPEDPDLFDLIIESIKNADDSGKIPFLIRTGALVGTGIQNNKLLENEFISEMNHPLVIFYPGEDREDGLFFLGTRRTSKYRGVTI